MLQQLQFTPIVKNLLFINVIMLLVTALFPSEKLIFNLLALHHPYSDYFMPVQFVSYMFLHAGIGHLFFNMFALFMFGRLLEQTMGSQRFFLYYITTGVGAGLLYTWINMWELEGFYDIAVAENNQVLLEQLRNIWDVPMVGASGAVFGILLAFGWLFPNVELFLLFFPFPIKAKYFVIGYGLIELFSGIQRRPGDNVAHFAHLGGMVVGIILLFIWKKKRTL